MAHFYFSQLISCLERTFQKWTVKSKNFAAVNDVLERKQDTN